MAFNYSFDSFRPWPHKTTSCILNSARLICSDFLQLIIYFNASSGKKIITIWDKNTMQMSKVQGSAVMNYPKANKLSALFTY